MNAAAVARVSSKKQRENTSPEEQLAVMRRAAAENGDTLVAELLETESGAMIEARASNPKSPVYQTLRMAERGEIKRVYFFVPDRAGRGDARAVIKYLYKRAGAEVVYAKGTHDTSTLTGFVSEVADQLTSGVERLKFIERSRDGKWARANAGVLMAMKAAPYGFEFIRKYDERTGRRLSTDLVHVPYQKRVWLRGYRLLTEKGYSLRAVAKQFEAEGVPTPAGASSWRVHTVRNMYRNPIYGGRWYYGLRITKSFDTPRGRKSRVVGIRDANDVAWYDVDGFITRAEWEALQQTIDDHKQLFIRPPKHQYLIRGVIRCQKCGRIMCSTPIGYKVKSGERRYKLYYSCRPHRHNAAAKCDSRQIRASDIESQMWRMIIEWITDDRRAGDPDFTGSSKDVRESTLIAERDNATARLKALDKQESKAGRAYVQDAMTKRVYDAEVKRITNERAEAERDLRDAEGALAVAAERAEAVDVAAKLKRDLRRLAKADPDMVSFEFKRGLIERIQLHGAYDGYDRVEFTSLIGIGTVILSR